MADQIAELEARLAHAHSRQEEVDALNDLAWNLRNSQVERSLALSLRAQALSSQGEFTGKPYKFGLAGSLTTQAYLHRHQGKLDVALDFCFQAIALFEAYPPSRNLIDCLRIISWVYYFLGDYSNALSYGLRALKIARDLQLKGQEASVLDNLAMIHASSDEVEQAAQEHAAALEIAQAVGDEALESVVLNNYAMLMLEHGNFTRALELGNKSLEIAVRLDYAEQKVAVSDTLGQIMLQLGDFSGAEKVFHEALSTAVETGQELGQAYCLLSLGGLALALQAFEAAEGYIYRSLEISQRIGAKPVQMDCHLRLTQIAEQRAKWEQAFIHQREFHEIFKETHSETSSKQIAILKVAHQVETARRDAEIYHLRNEELSREIEERKRMEAALQELAMTDPLTGLYNRRHFFSLANLLLDHANRYHRPLSILIIDIDHFKQVNDLHGHAVGDKAIKFLAATIRRSIRSVDVAARFGGDEFVIMMPETNAVQAAQTAERLRLFVAEHPADTGDLNVSITLSLGVTSTSLQQGEMRAIDALLEQADRALYTAKQSGRNQVQVFQ